MTAPIKKLFAFLATLTLLTLVTFGVSAQNLDPNKNCSLTLLCSSELSGATVKLYRAASLNGDGSLKIDSSLESSSIKLSGSDAQSLKTNALSLWMYVSVVENGIRPIAESTVDKNGQVKFSGLAVGAYLIHIDRVVKGDTVLISSPALVSLPQTDEENGLLVYDITTSPKTEKAELGNTKKIEVKKLWEDGSATNRPRSVTVSLFANGVFYDSTVLNAENAWSFSWNGLSPKVEWTTLEIAVPDGYTVSYAQSGAAVIIVNTGSADEPPTEPTKPSKPDTTADSTTDSSTTQGSSDSEKLPQTGLLQWPIPVLAVLGLLFFAIGWWGINNNRRGRV